MSRDTFPERRPSPVRVERLRERADFLPLRRGLVARGDLFTLQVSREPAPDRSTVRAGFTVTRKVGNAVERNRIKRRLREAVRLAAFPPRVAGRDLVLIARRGLLDAPYDRIVAEIERMAVKALAQRGPGAASGKQAPSIDGA